MGGIFGGGSSSTQTSQNTTTVNVENQISNVVDLSIIADALKATAGQTQELIGSLTKAQIITQLADVQARINQNEMIRKALKITGIAALAWFIWEKLYNGR